MIRIYFLILPLFIALIACQPRVIDQPQTAIPDIRVMIDEVSGLDSVEFNGEYLLKSEEAEYVFGGNNSKIYIKKLDKGFSIFNQNRIFRFTNGDQVSFAPAETNYSFVLNNTEYAGALNVLSGENGSLLLINKLHLETYLRGVVPAEIPSYKQDYLEAVKAQAVCARTYALKKMEQRPSGFDVYGDQRDQVYAGLTVQSSLANQAIDLTRGSVLMYNNEPAEIYYHSTCGGLLEASENVWPEAVLPYMNVRQDALGDRFACQNSPAFRWQQSFSLRELDSLFQVNFGRSYLQQPVQDTLRVDFAIRSLQRSSGGRVQSISLSYADTSVILQGLNIRKFFSKKGRTMRSTLFTVGLAGDSSLVFTGGGFGHGAGMCQYGALYMSEQGFKFYDILVNKYFRGTYLKRIY